MLDSIKQNKSAKVIIDFITESCSENVETISIPGIFEQKIYTNSESYEFTIKDKSINEFKIYKCFFHYKSGIISHSLTIYYDRINYYLFGREKSKNAVEIIFNDFIEKTIDIKKCYAIYKGKKYYAKDDKTCITRRYLNFINININELLLPKDLKGNKINQETLNDDSYLICISVSNNEPKTIGIYLNNPPIEKKAMDIKNLIKELYESVEKTKQILNYNKKVSFAEFKKAMLENNKTIINYLEEYNKSDILLKKVEPYFEFFRPTLNEEEMKAFDIYSDYIISFPKLYQLKKPLILQNFHVWKQYYYSQKVIENFMETIPPNLNEEAKIKLKYTACRCLKFMLLSGYGENHEKLFYFYDLNNQKQIYNDAISFNKKFIESLKESSELFLFFLELNSGSSINKLTGKLSARLSLLSLEQIKNHLKLTIPDYIIRINCSTNFNGITFNETRMTCINEIDLFGKFQSDEELMNDEDDFYNKRYILSNLMGHENFGHVKFSMNFFSFKQDNSLEDNTSINGTYEEPLSPKEYYNINIDTEKNDNKNGNTENLIEICEIFIENGKQIEKGESGTAFNFFLTRGNIEYMNLLKNRRVDFTNIFKNPQLLAEDDLTNYLNALKECSKDMESFKDDNVHISIGKYQIMHRNKLIISKDPTIAKFSI